ncbi:MAG: molybdenum cofactor guanylyltransferase [Synergistetes bacterium]|nr:molybdenum cofactor guanylyltransferase [Synergistota bacterium]
MLAVVFVGTSRRFPGKHFIEVRPGLRMIDLVISRLRAIGLDVLVYSKISFNCSVPLIKDNERWILPSLASLLEGLAERGIKEVIAVAGDMPLISGEGINLLINSLSDCDLAVIPRWENGFMEPLHAIYRSGIAPFFKDALESGISSLHGAIERSPWVKFIEAELFPSEAFFNVNEPGDLIKLRSKLEKLP